MAVLVWFLLVLVFGRFRFGRFGLWPFWTYPFLTPFVCIRLQIQTLKTIIYTKNNHKPEIVVRREKMCTSLKFSPAPFMLTGALKEIL